jgi:membrane protease YdiL (CAAX protease family)
MFVILVVPSILLASWPELHRPPAGHQDLSSQWGHATPATVLIQYIVIIGGTWILAGWLNQKPDLALALNAVAGGRRALLLSVGLFASIAVSLGFLIREFCGEDVLKFVPMTAGPLQSGLVAPLINAFAIVVLAPVAEELLFRGFLLSALSRSFLGFWPAAFVTNLMWTALHYQQPVLGLATVFISGLLLSYLLWRTGSLWTCIFAHGFYNAYPTTLLLLTLVFF